MRLQPLPIQETISIITYPLVTSEVTHNIHGIDWVCSLQDVGLKLVVLKSMKNNKIKYTNLNLVQFQPYWRLAYTTMTPARLCYSPTLTRLIHLNPRAW